MKLINSSSVHSFNKGLPRPYQTFERSQFAYMQICMNILFSQIVSFPDQMTRVCITEEDIAVFHRCLHTMKNISSSHFKTYERFSPSKYMPKILWH